MISPPLPGSVNNCIDTMGIPTKELSVVKALMSGDDRAFTRLYQDYAGSLLGIISKIVIHTETAQDILQETFAKIASSIGSYNATRGRLFTWMARIARNGAIDYLRSRACLDKRKNDNIDDLMEQLEIKFTSYYNTDTIGVKTLALGLSEKHKPLVELIYFKGYSHSEAAKELDIPLGTLKSRIKAAVSAMKPFFD